MSRWLWASVAFSSLFLLVVAFSAEAADAFMVPRSNKVIQAKMTLPDGSKAGFEERDGTWVTIEDNKDGYFVGFSGIVNKNGSTNFLPYELTRLSPDDTIVKELSPARDISVGRYVRFSNAKNIVLAVTGIIEMKFSDPPMPDPSHLSPLALSINFGVSGRAVCCVSCGNRTVCATSVHTSCGDCSVGGTIY